MSSWDLQRTERGWRLPIEQARVTRCIVDHAVALEFFEGELCVVVRVEGDFSILDGARVHRLSSSAPQDLGPAVGLLGQTVRSATTSAQGKLEIAFEDGRMLSVEPDERYEAWELCGPGGTRAVCMPGGEVAVW
ncbi:MAG: DUF6188 family protein [Myxococcota bacterium]|nr:DUF6188 family protein [Myxococcota bacterium]